jgi:hypothetical protein
VGENGAGKSTLLRICAGLVRPDGGEVSAAGRIGYCPQEPGLLELLKVDEYLRLFGAAVGLTGAAAVAHGRELLSELGFAEHRDGGEAMIQSERVRAAGVACGRDLSRRRVALTLLTALPLAFYAASAGEAEHGVEVGGIAMAFSVTGAAIFAAMTARAVDQRLALAGYSPVELLLGRLLVWSCSGSPSRRSSAR